MAMSRRLQEGLKWKNAHHLLLLWTPNILNPHKLAANVRHPVHEVFHTSHKQHPVKRKQKVEYYLVEHRLFGKLVTVDVVVPTSFPQGLIPRIRQLFNRNFYYGHDKDFPHPFMLVNRTFVRDRFNKKDYVRRVINNDKAQMFTNFFNSILFSKITPNLSPRL